MANSEQMWNPNKYGKGKGGYESIKRTTESEVVDAVSAERLGDVTGVAEKAKKLKEKPKEAMKDPDDCSSMSGLALIGCNNRKKMKK